MNALTDWLLALVPVYGIWLLALATFLSCLALPMPASILMMTAGAFVAAGDLSGIACVTAAFAGAVAGDQVGYGIGRRGGDRLLARIGRDPKRGKLLTRAIASLERHADWGLFFSRWLLAPLGPWTNFAAGAIRFDWRRFTLAGVLGEAVWVLLYIGLGYFFADNLTAASEILSNGLGFVTAGMVMLGLLWWLRAALRADRH